MLVVRSCGTRSALPHLLLAPSPSPGGSYRTTVWCDGVWSAFCAKYHVVRYDRRGYGRSEPAKSAFVPENDLFQIMRHVHMDRAILVGNSSGGGLALDFAIAHPAMVEALFLIGPVVHGMASSGYSTSAAARTLRRGLTVT